MHVTDKPDYVSHCSLCGWPEGQPWLSVAQVAASLGITPRKVREMIGVGAFSQVLKIANEWRIHHEALDGYIAEKQDLIGGWKKKFCEK